MMGCGMRASILYRFTRAGHKKNYRGKDTDRQPGLSLIKEPKMTAPDTFAS
jgi:hypothetical protein